MANRLLEGKNAVVTGCNRGIGLAILRQYAKNGANIFAVVRKERADFSEESRRLEQENNIWIREIYADFSKDDEIKNAAKEILQHKEKIDILVNNIGFASSSKMFLMDTMDSIRNVFQINLFSGLLFTQCLSRKMIRECTGSIIFISSTAVFDAFANVAYTASKAAVVGAVRRMASEYGNYNIRVNTIAPSLTDTEMGKVMGEEDELEAVSRNIMKRKASPEEIADVAVFLASDMSRFVTAQVLRADGGLL